MSDYDAIFEALRDQGFTLEQTSRGHWQAKPPDKTKPLVHFSESTSDHRNLQNAIRDLRRAGFVWPWTKELRAALFRTSPRELPGPGCTSCGAPPGCAHHPQCAAPPAAPSNGAPPAPEIAPDVAPTLDQLWKELRDAKDDFELAKLHTADTERALAVALHAHDAAKSEQRRAADALAKAKQRFDEVFAVA